MTQTDENSQAVTEARWGIAPTDDPVETERRFAHWVLNQELPSCGCGDPQGVLNLIRGVLESCPLYNGGYRDLVASVGGNEPAAELILHAIEAADLIEHGTFVGSSWITEKGTRFLAAITAQTHDEIHELGYGTA